MATKLSQDELVSLNAQRMSNEIYMAAIIQRLVDKGVFTKVDFLGKIKQVQANMPMQKGQ